jgi:CDP-diacylglycerol---glycerol-3-phosphate 3-phosphatidyltransferase
MNLPNRLTLLRLVLILPFVAALSTEFTGGKIFALFIFLAGTATDYADGFIARKFHLITDFGRLMDPLVDKMMTVAAFICLVALGLIPAWAVIAIVSREFLITGLRLVAASRGLVLPAEKLGKHKTVWQMVTIVYYLLLLSVEESAPRSLTGSTLVTLERLGTAFLAVTVALTLWSGISYLTRHWDLLREN